MIFGSLMLVIAITISAIAAWYSVAGLTAIFSAAVIPVIIMGGALEAGKIAATVWLHNNWRRAGVMFKVYLVPAIAFLMLLTSMGIFGFLSRAHSDQNLVTGDAVSKVAIYDEKIATERDNIEQAKRALAQMNAQVDQMLGRSDNERGAERAVQIRKTQARERAALQEEITKSQKEIARLQEERAPLAAETRKIEAEVGPIKYIAALIYGDTVDQTLLERAVRWVIILIVVVFDPLALTLILAANKQFEWARLGIGGWNHREEEKPAAEVVAANAGDRDLTPPEDSTADALDAADEQRRAEEANTAIAEIDPPEPVVEVETEPTKSPEDIAIANMYLPKDEDIAAYDNERLVSKFDKESLAEDEHPNAVVTVTASAITADNEVPQPPVADEIKEIDNFNTPIRRGQDYAVRYRGKVYNLDAFKALYPSLQIKADNDVTVDTCGFGDKFPLSPVKGDMFIRTDYLPEKLYKWNGNKWLEIDKKSTDSYTYNRAYINHLIQKLEAGEYELEDLNEAEQAQVESQIKEILNGKNIQ